MPFDPDIQSKYGPQYAKLVDDKVIPLNVEEWCQWISEGDGQCGRRVDRYETDTHLVSTVFLGINHNWIRHVRPVWFETMVFDKATQGQPIELMGNIVGTNFGDEIYCERYTTFEEALRGHQTAIAWLNAELARQKREQSKKTSFP